MRILSITSSYPRHAGDPTAPFIESITQHIAARSHEVHLVLPEHRAWDRPAVEAGVHYHPYRYSPRRNWTPWGYSASLEGGTRIRRKLYALAPIVSASAVRACNRVLANGSFDLVHVHWVVPNGPIGAYVARRHRLPLVISLHGSDISVAQQSSGIGHVARACFDRADAITAPSEDLLGRARRLGAKGSLELIPYGADVEAFNGDDELARRVRTELGIGRDMIVICAVGRFVRWKGFDDLTAAFARASTSLDRLRLLLVGDGDLREELHGQASALGIVDKVTFMGMAEREAMPGYLAAADIVVVPSVHTEGYVDGLPNVALEALASARALVATRVGGLPQLVRSGENGLLVDERDPGALAEAIATLARDPDLRRKLGARGRRMMVESLTWDVTAERFQMVFERSVSGHGTPRGSRSSTPTDDDHRPRRRSTPRLSQSLGVLYFGTYERHYPRNAQVISSLRTAGVEVVERHVPVWEEERHKFSPGLRALSKAAAAQARLALTSDHEADLLIVGYPGHLDLLAARRVARGRPVVFNPLVSLEDTIVSDRELAQPDSFRARALYRIDRTAFRKADLVVADTSAHASYFATRFGLSPERLAVCVVGAEDRLFRPGPRSREPFRVLFVGKLIPLHGIETILSAAALSPEIDFLVVGTGQLNDRLARRPRNVHWEPWVAYERLPDLYQSAGCALGIFGTSSKAGRVIPNKAFQALATETPLITADTPACRELLRHEHDALLVPAGDPKAIASAVRRLASDPTFAGELGRRGRATYVTQASEEVLGRRWRTLLAHLVEAGR